jgi:hypothetical protein
VPLGLWEAHAFGAMAVEDFEGVAVEDGDDGVSLHAPRTKWYPRYLDCSL